MIIFSDSKKQNIFLTVNFVLFILTENEQDRDISNKDFCLLPQRNNFPTWSLLVFFLFFFSSLNEVW